MFLTFLFSYDSKYAKGLYGKGAFNGEGGFRVLKIQGSDPSSQKFEMFLTGRKRFNDSSI
jgi:hypothetical protein